MDVNDFASAQQFFGSNFAELAALYRTDTPKRIAAMRHFAISGNKTQTAALAHILGGSCALIGAGSLASLCRELELCCKSAETGEIDLLLNQIEDTYAEIDQEIKALLQSATP